MKLYVFYFDPTGAGKYLPQLARIQAGLARFNRTAVLLTDLTTPQPAGWESERWDPSPWLARYHRAGVDGAQWDYKACLLMAKYEKAQTEPAVYLDADNIVHGDPVPALTSVKPGRLALGPDGATRTIIHPHFKGSHPEHSTSIMVMPADSRTLCAVYRNLWESSSEPTHYLLEQRTWSLVLKATAGELLPRSLAWSKLWGMPPPPDTLIEHPHGPRKWEGL